MKYSIVKTLSCVFLLGTSVLHSMERGDENDFSARHIQEKEYIESLPQSQSIKREFEMIKAPFIVSLKEVSNSSYYTFIDRNMLDYSWENLKNRPFPTTVEKNSKTESYNINVDFVLQTIERVTKKVETATIPLTLSKVGGNEIVRLYSPKGDDVQFSSDQINIDNFSKDPNHSSFFVFTKAGEQHLKKIYEEMEKVIAKYKEQAEKAYKRAIDQESYNKEKIIDIISITPVLTVWQKNGFFASTQYIATKAPLAVPAAFKKSIWTPKDGVKETITALSEKKLTIKELTQWDGLSPQEQSSKIVEYLIDGIFTATVYKPRDDFQNKINYVFQPFVYYHPTLTVPLRADPNQLFNVINLINSRQAIQQSASKEPGSASLPPITALKRAVQLGGNLTHIGHLLIQGENVTQKLLAEQSFGNQFMRVQEGILSDLVPDLVQDEGDRDVWVKQPSQTQPATFMVYNSNQTFYDPNFQRNDYQTSSFKAQAEYCFQKEFFDEIQKRMDQVKRGQDLVVLIPIATQGFVGHAVFLSMVMTKESNEKYNVIVRNHDSVTLGADKIIGVGIAIRDQLSNLLTKQMKEKGVTTTCKTETLNSGTQELFAMDCVYQSLNSMVIILTSKNNQYFQGIKDTGFFNESLQKMKNMAKGSIQQSQLLVGMQDGYARPWEKVTTPNPSFISVSSLITTYLDYDKLAGKI